MVRFEACVCTPEVVLWRVRWSVVCYMRRRCCECKRDDWVCVFMNGGGNSCRVRLTVQKPVVFNFNQQGEFRRCCFCERGRCFWRKWRHRNIKDCNTATEECFKIITVCKRIKWCLTRIDYGTFAVLTATRLWAFILDFKKPFFSTPLDWTIFFKGEPDCFSSKKKKS